MPLTLNVGVSKKLGQPNYGSLGASCYVEIDLDPSLVFEDPEKFQRKVKKAYAVCRQAVNDELATHRETNGHPAAGDVDPSGSPQSAGQNVPRASQKQIDYAQQLAERIRGLGVPRLEALATKMFSKPLGDLSSLEASGLIDTLKDLKNGKIELSAALNGADA